MALVAETVKAKAAIVLSLYVLYVTFCTFIHMEAQTMLSL